MSKLEKLYSIIENSREVGVQLPEGVIQQVEELEEKIIKEEILPSLSNDIAPRLRPIKRDVVLVVEYHPGQDISVALSRKVKVAEALGAKPLELDPQVQHSEGKKAPKTKVSPQTGLCIYLPDGSFIQKTKASETMVEAVRIAGARRVRALNITLSRVPLVSNTKDKKYAAAQHEVEPGLYVITHSNTKDKKRLLERISKSLNLHWRIVIIDKDGEPISDNNFSI